MMPAFIVALVESADDSGMCWNILGSSMRSPCNLAFGFPIVSQATDITDSIRRHHPSVPGVAH